MCSWVILCGCQTWGHPCDDGVTHVEKACTCTKLFFTGGLCGSLGGSTLDFLEFCPAKISPSRIRVQVSMLVRVSPSGKSLDSPEKWNRDKMLKNVTDVQKLSEDCPKPLCKTN